MLIKKPAYASAFPKLQNALEEAFVAEGKVPQEMRPRWMRDNIATQIGADPKARFLLLSLFTPAQEMFEMGQGLMGQDGFVEALKFIASSANPVLKVPFELSVGKELFTGRDIGDPNYGKISYMDYVAQQIRPYREIRSIARNIQKGDFRASDAVNRVLFGGRVQPARPQRLEQQTEYQSGVTVRAFRHRIRKFINDGDDEAAKRLALKLEGHYKMIWNMGLTDAVPRSMRAKFMREQFEAEGLVESP